MENSAKTDFETNTPGWNVSLSVFSFRLSHGNKSNLSDLQLPQKLCLTECFQA